MRTKLSLLLLAGIALSGCVKEKAPKSAPLVLNLNSTWSPDQEDIPIVRSGSDLLPLPEGTTLGVRIQDKTNGGATASYLSYTASANGSVAPTGSGLAPQLTPGRNYDLYLYSPFHAGSTTEATFAHGQDVMWVEVKENVKAGETVARTLIHKMSQAELIPTYEAGTPQEIKDNFPLDRAEIEITGFYDNCTMDFATGVITPSTTRNATITEIGKAICFVPFASRDNMVMLTLTLNGLDGQVKKYPPLEHSVEIGAGISTELTITIDEESLVYPIKITSTVTAWKRGNDVPIDISEYQ